jgi:hypothetical protein
MYLLIEPVVTFDKSIFLEVPDSIPPKIAKQLPKEERFSFPTLYLSNIWAGVVPSLAKGFNFL